MFIHRLELNLVRIYIFLILNCVILKVSLNLPIQHIENSKLESITRGSLRWPKKSSKETLSREEPLSPRIQFLFEFWVISELLSLKKWAISKLWHVMDILSWKFRETDQFEFWAISKFSCIWLNVTTSPSMTFWAISRIPAYAISLILCSDYIFKLWKQFLMG